MYGVCGLGVDPPITAADAQALIAAALANQQLALASQLANEKNEERSHMMEWQAMRAGTVADEIESQWVEGVSNKTVLVLAAAVAVAWMMGRK